MTGATDQVIKDLLGFHDCADGDVDAGNGHFRLVCISDSDQQRLNLRAVLREAAHDLDAAQTRIRELEAECDRWAEASIAEDTRRAAWRRALQEIAKDSGYAATLAQSALAVS